MKSNFSYYENLKFYDKYDSSMYLFNDSYEEVSKPNQWKECPDCHLKPLIWIFDNGAYTACGCGKNMYDHLSIRTESINSKYNRLGNTIGDTEEELMENWNHYCETHEDNFSNLKKKLEAKGINIY